jgi:farnesyl-diphosphate farnesyltransferase
MLKSAKEATRLPEEPNQRFCYDMLNRVSRSFAIVIQQLPKELRDAICIFYLVLRALDTVEDDMAIAKKEKVPLLKAFHEKIYDRSGVRSAGGTGQGNPFSSQTDPFHLFRVDPPFVSSFALC